MNFTSENPQRFYTLHWKNIWQKRLKIDKLSSVKHFRTHKHPLPWFLPALLDHRMRSISVLQQNRFWGSWSYWCPSRFGRVSVHNLEGNPSPSPALKQGFPTTRAELVAQTESLITTFYRTFAVLHPFCSEPLTWEAAAAYQNQIFWRALSTQTKMSFKGLQPRPLLRNRRPRGRSNNFTAAKKGCSRGEKSVRLSMKSEENTIKTRLPNAWLS